MSTKSATPTTKAPNAWGGMDRTTEYGMVRTTVEDSERHVYTFSGAHNGTLVWQASFSTGTPIAIYEQAVDLALANIGAAR